MEVSQKQMSKIIVKIGGKIATLQISIKIIFSKFLKHWLLLVTMLGWRRTGRVALSVGG